MGIFFIFYFFKYQILEKFLIIPVIRICVFFFFFCDITDAHAFHLSLVYHFLQKADAVIHH